MPESIDELELPEEWDTSGLAEVARETVAAPAWHPPMAPIGNVPRGTPAGMAAPMGQAGIAEVQRARDEYARRMAEVRQTQRELLQAREQAGAPIQSRLEALAAQPTGAAPAPPPIPPPPVRQFRPFLEGTPGESPSRTLNRVLLGLGTMAMQAAGIFNGFPQGALRAFTGALQGWSAGDRQRGDAEFQNWKNQVDTAQAEWRNARQEFADALATKHASLEDLQESLKSVTRKYDMPLKMTELIEKDITGALRMAEDWGKTLVTLDRDAAKLTAEREIANIRDITQRNIADAVNQSRREAITAQTARATLDVASREKLAADRLAQERAEEAGRGARHAESIKVEREKLAKTGTGQKLPAKAVEDMQDIRGVVAGLDRIAQTYDPAFVGPLAGRAGELRRRGGSISTQESEFRSAVAELNNMLLKVRSGAAVTPQEFERLQKELPTPNDGPEDFVTKRARARQSWADALGRKAETWSAQGYLVSPELGSAPTAPTSTPREKSRGDSARQGRVRIRRSSDGLTGTIPGGQAIPSGWVEVK